MFYRHLLIRICKNCQRTKISYKKITPDSLVAEISGEEEGKNKSQQFTFKRVE